MSIKFSFEFFPPKTDAGAVKLREVHKTLAATGPEYFSVTYGAGGSTRERTIGTVLDMAAAAPVEVAPHLSCIGDSREALGELLDLYKSKGIRRIVALRGDLPSGQVGLGELPYARDLVEFIRNRHGDHFHIEVAAYPEVHPQAENFDADLRNFVAKAKAGADAAITQYFYNADAYFHFVERVQAAGVDIPLVPGIMPITNYSNLVRFSDACGAEVPRWLRKQLAAYGDDIESIQKLGEEVVTQLCERLIAGGAPGIHFYSMNQAEPTLALLRNLKLGQ